MQNNCIKCEKSLTPDDIGASKKLINRGMTTDFLCVSCLAEKYGVTEAQAMDNDYLVFEGVVVNKADMSLKVDGELIAMTRKEIELLVYLLTHRGQILSREHLLKNVWDSNGYVMERTVDVHITHLRRKLGTYGKHIITKSGFGYMFQE